MNLVELLTTVAIVGTLSVVGIRTYQTQVHKSRMTEAKQSLSFVYTAQKNFRDTWGTYHENLMSVGAIPQGAYHYDVGFGKSVSLSNTEGNLGNFPLQTSLNVRECTSFYQICKGDCITQTKAVVGTVARNYFKSEGCKVNGKSYVKDYTGAPSTTANAQETSFKVLATGELKNNDVWSMSQDKTVNHEEDGS